MTEQYSACGDHSALNTMEFERALAIARDCPNCSTRVKP
jgi:hypothetical protein